MRVRCPGTGLTPAEASVPATDSLDERLAKVRGTILAVLAAASAIAASEPGWPLACKRTPATPWPAAIERQSPVVVGTTP
jgi:hypothetical protein